jgi:hypothetical protein
MDKRLRQIYFDEYKHGKISSNDLSIEIASLIIREKEVKNIDSICNFIEEKHVVDNIKEKINKQLEYLKNI